MSDTFETWRNHVDRAKAAGTTDAEYCRHNGLNKNLFAYWKKKLGMAVRRGSRKRPAGFVEVPESYAHRGRTAALEIQFAGIELSLIMDFDRLLK